MLTNLLIFAIAQQVESSSCHTGVGEEGDGFIDAAYVRGAMCVVVGRDGICHVLENAFRAHSVGCHDGLVSRCE